MSGTDRRIAVVRSRAALLMTRLVAVGVVLLAVGAVASVVGWVHAGSIATSVGLVTITVTPLIVLPVIGHRLLRGDRAHAWYAWSTLVVALVGAIVALWSRS
ncbi:MAG TPA: hypothetical protein VGA37_00900 [Gemmatimonadales bacterium]